MKTINEGTRKSIKVAIREAFENDYPRVKELFFKYAHPGNPEIYNEHLYRWQSKGCIRYVAIYRKNIVGHVAVIENVHAGGNIKWASGLVLDTSDQEVCNVTRQVLLGACMPMMSRERRGVVGVKPKQEQMYVERGYVIDRTSCRMYLAPINPLSLTTGFFSRVFLHFAMLLSRTLAPWASKEVARERHTDIPDLRRKRPSYRYRNHRRCNSRIDYRTGTRQADGLDFVKILHASSLDNSEKKGAAQLIRTIVAQSHKKKTNSGVIAIDLASNRWRYFFAGMVLSKPYPIVVSPRIEKDVRITLLTSDLDNSW